jgi:hypothetical protein
MAVTSHEWRAGAIDELVVFLAIAAPVAVIALRQRCPILVATIVSWGLIALASFPLQILDPASRDGFTTFFDMLWIALGWIPVLAYCSLLYAIKAGAMRVCRHRMLRPSRSDPL